MVKSVELLKIKIGLEKYCVFFDEVDMVEFGLVFEVFNIYMFGLMFFLNNDNMELNVNFFLIVGIVLMIMYRVFKLNVFCLFCDKNNFWI